MPASHGSDFIPSATGSTAWLSACVNRSICVGFFVWTRKATDETKLASRSEDAEVDAFLKDVKLSFQSAHAVKRGSGHHASSGSKADDAEFNNDANFGDASKYASAGDETLDDGVIEETMMHHYRGLVPCLMAERKHNPGMTEMNGQKGGFASCVLSRMPMFPKFNGSKTIASWSMSMR